MYAHVTPNTIESDQRDHQTRKRKKSVSFLYLSLGVKKDWSDENLFKRKLPLVWFSLQFCVHEMMNLFCDDSGWLASPGLRFGWWSAIERGSSTSTTPLQPTPLPLWSVVAWHSAAGGRWIGWMYRYYYGLFFIYDLWVN